MYIHICPAFGPQTLHFAASFAHHVIHNLIVHYKPPGKQPLLLISINLYPQNQQFSCLKKIGTVRIPMFSTAYLRPNKTFAPGEGLPWPSPRPLPWNSRSLEPLDSSGCVRGSREQ